MKHLTWLFLLISFSATAQNWSLIQSGKRLNYNKAGQTLVNATLRVGSAYAEGGDSVFIMLPKRAKYYPSYPYVEAVGHILGDTAVLHPGGIYEFRFGYSDSPQPTTEVRTQAKSGDTWAYQPDIDATVAVVKDTVIWGQNDSLKIIQLSDGRNFRLSKNFGLIAYDGLILSGLQGQGIGTQLPTMADWYGDWQPGAVFETQSNTVSNYISRTSVWAKFYVTGRSIVNDSLKMTCRRLTRTEFSFNGAPPTVSFEDKNLTLTPLRADSIIYPGARSGVYETYFQMFNGNLTLTDSRIVTPVSSSPIDDESYRLGKGLTYERFAYGSISDTYSFDRSLIGSQLPGQTFEGTIHPDSYFGLSTQTEEQPDANTVNVFPNPVRAEWVWVDWNGNTPLSSIQLIGMNGQVQREWANPCIVCFLELGTLPEGLYVLRLQPEGEKAITRKIFVRQ